jgi:hypothetical protein
MFPRRRVGSAVGPGRSVAVGLLLAVVVPSRAFALAADYGPDEFTFRPGAIGDQVPFHGYWVNSQDFFFYAGDASAFNQFIEAYSTFKHKQLQVVIHVSQRRPINGRRRREHMERPEASDRTR